MKVKNSKPKRKIKAKDPLEKIKGIFLDSKETLKLAAEDGCYWLAETQQSILEDIGKAVKRTSAKNPTIKECQKLMIRYQEEFEIYKDDEILRRAIVGNVFYMLQEIIHKGKKFYEFSEKEGSMLRKIWRKIFGPKKILAQCGHETKLQDEVSAFGQTTVTTITPHKDGKVEYCHRCLEKMAICCAWCGKPIFIGDPVTLYTRRNKDFVIPSCAIIFAHDPLQLVGCLRWNCAESGADRAGFWLPPGQVYRVPTPLEIVMSGEKEILAVNNLSDIKKATKWMEGKDADTF